MALWSVALAGTRETAVARWRRKVRGVRSGFECDAGSRFAFTTGNVALRTKRVSTFILRIHHPLLGDSGESTCCDNLARRQMVPIDKASTLPARIGHL